MRKILVVLLILLLTGLPNCDAAKRPFSIEITDIDKKIVAEQIIRDMLNSGFNVLTTNEYQVAFRKDVKNFWGQVFLGSRFNTVPEMRCYYNLIQTGPNVRVTLEVKIATNPNSGFEHYTEVTHKSWQEYLDKLKIIFNGAYLFGFNHKEKDDQIVFHGIIPGSNADKAGLKDGDILLAINGKSAKDMSIKKFLKVIDAIPRDQAAKFTVMSGSKEQTLTITRGFFPSPYQRKASALPVQQVGSQQAVMELEPELGWQKIVEWNGKGTKNTETISIPAGEWRIRWSTIPGLQGAKNFQISVYKPDATLVSVAADITGEDTDSSIIRGAGEYYLAITSGQPYVVAIEVKE